MGYLKLSFPILSERVIGPCVHKSLVWLYSYLASLLHVVKFMLWLKGASAWDRVFFTLCDPIRVGDLGLDQKIDFCKVLGCYSPFCFFSSDRLFARNCLAHTQLSLKKFCVHSVFGKNYSHRLSHRQIIIRIKPLKNQDFFAMAECLLKIISRELSVH